MPTFLRIGHTPRKRFSQFRADDGSLYSTEVMGEEGFSSDFSLLIHANCPAALRSIEAMPSPALDDATEPNHPVSPRLWTTSGLGTGGDLVGSRSRYAGNDDVLISFGTGTETSPLYRNSTADELVFIHDGEGRLETSVGSIDVMPGDYVVVPKGLTHRWAPGAGGLRALIVETAGHIRCPERYLSRQGQLLQTAPYSELDFRAPTEPLIVEGHDVEVIVKTREGFSRHVYADHPFDVVGWFGCNYPYALNIADFSPVTGSFHRPPPIHQVFEAPQLVICNFVPRMLDYDERAMPIPSFHHNVDSDEVIFYAEGDFFSRRGAGIERGAMTLHPAGHIHGPHPASLERGPSLVGTRSAETAVMVDTFRPLRLAPEAAAHERSDYATSWTRMPPTSGAAT